MLNLLVLVGEAGPQNHQALSGPIRKALDELWKEQRADGAWECLDFGLEPYESSDSVHYGAAVAAMAAGSAAGYNDCAGKNASVGVDKLRAYLKAMRTTGPAGGPIR